jgi:hypothetical protein
MVERRCVFERSAGVWHVVGRTVMNGEWADIRCSADEGICFPSTVERRVPTCPACLALIAPVRGGSKSSKGPAL